MVKETLHQVRRKLSVSKVENDAFRCFCWQQVNARTLNIKGGSRRLPDMTQAEWMERAGEAPRSAWWVEDGSFKNGIYVHGARKRLMDVVDSVKPHSGE